MTCSCSGVFDRSRDLQSDLGDPAGVVLAVLHGLRRDRLISVLQASYHGVCLDSRLAFAAS